MAPPKYREIREEHSFRQSVERLGGARRLDRVLTALMAGLSFRPEGFPLAGEHGLRLAKTEPIEGRLGEAPLPSFRLYFQISDRGVVLLHWIEEVPSDDDLPF